MSDDLHNAGSGAEAAEDGQEDPRVLEAMQEYLAEIDAGRKVDRRAFVARHPEIAGELSACLQGLAFLNAAASEFQRDANVPDPAEQHRLDRAIAMAEPLGDFKLVREIGRGGMGVVYEAIQLSLGRRVAVKVLPLAASLDRRQLQRFHNEAQAAASLHHTHIVPVYAVGSERSVHYYAMQLIEGRSLADVVRAMRAREEAGSGTADGSGGGGGERGAGTGVRGALPPVATTPAVPSAEAARDLAALSGDPSILELSQARILKRPNYYRTVCRLIVQAAEALDYAHGLGIVHRDVKPANLLLDHHGSLWVTDFGLAQIYASGNSLNNDADAAMTQPGDLVGTYLYMSPEQAAGRSAVLDQRTDVYSLGITLYELLTLRRAVTADNREDMLRQILDRELHHPRDIDRRIPEELATILAKATAKDPAERYGSCRAFADDLERFLRDEPIRARPPTFRDKAWKFVRRHRGLSLMTAAALILASVGLSASNVLIAREQRRTEAAYALQLQKAREASRNFEEARQAVEIMTRVAEQELPRNFELVYVRRRLLEAALTFHVDLLNRQNSAGLTEELRSSKAHIAAMLTELSAVDEMIRVDHRQYLLTERPVQVELDLTDAQLHQLGQLRQQRDGPGPLWGSGGGGGGGGGPRGGFGGPAGGPRGGPGGGPGGEPRGAKGSDQYNPGPPEPWRGQFATAENRGPASAAPNPTSNPTASTQSATFSAAPLSAAEALLAAARANDAAMNAVLTPQQAGRLKQISRQSRGIFAFTDPDVIEVLSPTDDQMELIRVLCSRLAAANGPGARGGGPGGPGGPNGGRDWNGPGGPPGSEPGGGPGPGWTEGSGRGPTQNVGPGPSRPRFSPSTLPNQPTPATALGEVLQHLTPLQLRAWKAMIGPPFDTTSLRPPPRFGRPPPR